MKFEWQLTICKSKQSKHRMDEHRIYNKKWNEKKKIWFVYNIHVFLDFRHCILKLIWRVWQFLVICWSGSIIAHVIKVIKLKTIAQNVFINIHRRRRRGGGGAGAGTVLPQNSGNIRAISGKFRANSGQMSGKFERFFFSPPLYRVSQKKRNTFEMVAKLSIYNFMKKCRYVWKAKGPTFHMIWKKKKKIMLRWTVFT